jgi:hypothetical protein
MRMLIPLKQLIDEGATLVPFSSLGGPHLMGPGYLIAWYLSITQMGYSLKGLPNSWFLRGLLHCRDK